MSVQARLRLELAVIAAIALVAIAVMLRLPDNAPVADSSGVIAACYDSTCYDDAPAGCAPRRAAPAPCNIARQPPPKPPIGPGVDLLSSMTGLLIVLGLALLLALALVFMLGLLVSGVWKIDGKQGPQGPKGDTGDKGADGAQGPQGPKGDVGPPLKGWIAEIKPIP